MPTYMSLIPYVQDNTIYGRNGEKVQMECLRNNILWLALEVYKVIIITF